MKRNQEHRETSGLMSRPEQLSKESGPSNLQSKEPIALGQNLITAKARGVLHPQRVLAALFLHAQGGELISAPEIPGGSKTRIVTAKDKTAKVIALTFESDLSDVGGFDAWVCGYGCRTCGG